MNRLLQLDFLVRGMVKENAFENNLHPDGYPSPVVNQFSDSYRKQSPGKNKSPESIADYTVSPKISFCSFMFLFNYYYYFFFFYSAI